jgi:hypothetical protein
MHAHVLLAAAHLDDRDGVGGSIELGVGQILDQPALGACARVARIERRLGVSILEVLADHGGVVQGEIAVDDGRHLRARVHVQEVRPVAVAMQRADALERNLLLVEDDAHLPRVWTEHVIKQCEHAPSGRRASVYRTRPNCKTPRRRARSRNAGSASIIFRRSG